MRDSVTCGILVIVFLLTGQVRASGEWALAPANLTINEYLELYFHSYMGQQEQTASPNAFALVSFFPSKEPADAFVLIIQAWDESRLTERNERREIRKLGDVMFSQFQSIRELPSIRQRWPLGPSVKPQLIVKHVRKSDLKEVLGVTLDGLTAFDEDTIKKAELSVRERGGVWF